MESGKHAENFDSYIAEQLHALNLVQMRHLTPTVNLSV